MLQNPHPERKETIHIQFGLRVYIFSKDKIFDLRVPEEAKEVWSSGEVVGSNQGDGVETQWWDGSNEPLMQSFDADALAYLGRRTWDRLRREARIQAAKDAENEPQESPETGSPASESKARKPRKINVTIKRRRTDD